jgi:hypothetical protein
MMTRRRIMLRFSQLHPGFQSARNFDCIAARRLVASWSAVAKYDGLFEHLCRAGDGPITLGFDEIEQMVGQLPASATKYPAWWGNDAGAGGHVQAKAWLNSGREVESVDIAARRVRFSAARWRRGS